MEGLNNPPLWDAVNFMYHAVMDYMPASLQQRDLVSAFVLGSAGTFFLGKLAQLACKPAPKLYEKILPGLERLAIYGIPAGIAAYAVVDPDGAREILSMHPVYSSGMLGVYVGGGFAARQHLGKIEESLENRL